MLKVSSIKDWFPRMRWFKIEFSNACISLPCFLMTWPCCPFSVFSLKSVADFCNVKTKRILHMLLLWYQKIDDLCFRAWNIVPWYCLGLSVHCNFVFYVDDIFYTKSEQLWTIAVWLLNHDFKKNFLSTWSIRNHDKSQKSTYGKWQK